MRALRPAAVWTFVAWAAGTVAAAEAPEPPPPRTVTTAAGPRYGAGPFRRVLLGSGYRHLWVVPIEVEVLDLGSFAGGLEPLKTGGGKQTRSLQFEAADGRRFKVRSVDKDPSRVVPSAVRPVVDALVEDTTSALLPGGALVVARLLEAAGVLHVESRLVVVPDDPRLGEFREEFAGMLGQLEEVPREGLTRGFERATEIVDWEALGPRFEKSARDRVDSEAFLRARLVDLLVGDWDRHDLQWDWARVEGSPGWQPIPADRDQAFSRFDGLLIDVVRLSQPRLVQFDEEYPSMLGLTWNARFVDRRVLAGLEWRVWERTVADLRRRLTDHVIEAAVRELPPEYVRLEGPRLTRALRHRRDLLSEAAREHYLLLAREVAIQATDAAERAEVTRGDDGSLSVRVFAPESEEPYLSRRFVPGETEEVRLMLRGGHDRLTVRGGPRDGIKLRVVGGPGSDLLDDSAGGGTRLYDAEGENRVVEGPGTRFDDQPYEHPKDRSGNPMRDWGRAVVPVPWLEASPDVGVLLGGGVQATRYGFRRHPFHARHVLRAGYATGARSFGAEYELEFRRINSRRHAHVLARASGFEFLRFHGFGNETPSIASGRYYKLDQRQFLLAPLVSLPVPRGELNVGPVVKFHHTPLREGRFIAESRPYGVGNFGQAGLRADLLVDTREGGGHPRRGVRLDVGGSGYPAVWSATRPFGEAHGSAATYLSAPLPLRPTLALRAGVKHVWGRYPFHESAVLGGSTVRSLRSQRYAGDTAVYGNAELRVKAGPVGVFGLLDAGRVYWEGEDSRRWHTATGGGLRLALPGGEKAVVLTAAYGDARWRFYIGGGGSF